MIDSHPRIRAVLESLRLSPGSQGDARARGCVDACSAVEGVLQEQGLRETLRAALRKERLLLEERQLEAQRLLLEEARECKRLEEAQRRQLEEAQRQKELEEAPRRREPEEAPRRKEPEEAHRREEAEEAPNDAASEEAPKDAASEEAVRRDAPLHGRGAAERQPGSVGTRDAGMLQWFLDHAEGLLSHVLTALDGGSLAELECASRWPAQLGTTSLPGVWRFVHMCALGGQPPRALARPPKLFSGPLRPSDRGPWKAYWMARQSLLEDPDLAQHKVAAESARLLLGADFHAWVQPVKPNWGWLQSVLDRVAPAGHATDGRFGPLASRWHTHLMVSGEAMVTEAEGVVIIAMN